MHLLTISFTPAVCLSLAFDTLTFLLRVMHSTNPQPYRGETSDTKKRMTYFMGDIITIIWYALEKLPRLSIAGLSVPSERRAEQAIATYLGMPRQ